jgi:gliding motility-associated-like protein
MKKILTSLVFLSFLITGFSQNLDSMLLLYYPFSGNANDASGNGYHGTVFNATLADDRFGNPNSAYYFNGVNSYIEFPNVAALKPPLPVSFSFWIQIENYDFPYTNFFTTDYEENMCSGAWGNFLAGTGRIALNYGDGAPNSTGPQDRRTKIGNSQFLLNTWYFVIFIIRGPQDMDIYVNCLNDGGTYSGTGGPLAYTSNAGNLGKHDLITDPPFFFLGYLDEFRYWDRALTQADIDLMCSLQADAGTDVSICSGDSIQLGGTPAATNGTPPYAYTWSPSAGLNNPSIPNPMASPNVTTTYTLFVQDNFGVTDSDAAIVTVNQSPVVEMESSVTFCETESVTLDAGSGHDSYIWSTSQTTQTISVSSPGTYSVTVSNSSGCTASAQIIATGVSQYDATILTTGPFCDDVVFVNLQSAHPGGLWSGDGIIDENNGYFNPSLHGVGDYLITYEIPDPCGNSDSVIITVEDCTVILPHIYVPNVFSPNGDGENDVLFVRGEGIQYIEFIIYNRWGEQIFITNDINNGWDGTYKGKMCDPAVFTYLVNATFTNGEKVVKSGNVTLVR